MTSTSRLQIPEVASSENISSGPAKINEGWTAVDNVNQGQQDFLQPGIVGSPSWSFTATINTSTGAISSEASVAESVAWLPDPVISGALMRSSTTAGAITGIGPSKLPVSGKYISAAVEITPGHWGGPATVTVHSSTEEKSTEAEAKEHPPATTSGKLQIRRFIIHYSGTIYSIGFQSQEDLRPWATGSSPVASTTAPTFAPGVQTSIIATEQEREATEYGKLMTPDEVTVTLPESGFLVINFRAVAKSSVSGDGRVALFMGPNRIVSAYGSGGGYMETAIGGTSENAVYVAESAILSTESSYGGDVTTGQLIGNGALEVFAAAGTYVISAQYKATSGKITVKNRKLWVRVV